MRQQADETIHHLVGNLLIDLHFLQSGAFEFRLEDDEVRMRVKTYSFESDWLPVEGEVVLKTLPKGCPKLVVPTPLDPVSLFLFLISFRYF